MAPVCVLTRSCVFSKLEKSVSKAVTSNETKIKDAIALFTASTEESLKKHREGVK
ncbi:MbeB family mobilization protein, partial [Escherichia coli]|uniref:MbeB family mobilization protein n=1 Tax=Escherichia coli TaxID=562 RepID=UPI003EE0BD0B